MELNYQKEDTIVMSDFHLGSRNSKSKEIARFLNELLRKPLNRLVLAGDMFEFWSASYKNIGIEEHRIIKLIAQLSENGTKIVYIPGNHDRAFRAFPKLTFGRVKMRNEYIIKHDHKKYLVIHGDEFDAFTRNHAIVSILIDQLYVFLIRINSFLRTYSRSKKSLSALKHSRTYAETVEKIRSLAISYARSRKLDGIIIGHSHWPELVHEADGVMYANAGDWIESCSYVVIGDNIRLEYFK